MKMPDFRKKEDRDLYRHDVACTDAKTAGEQLLPVSSYPAYVYSDEEKAALKKQWEESQKGE